MAGESLPCFEVIAGPETGRVFRLFEGITTIGRTSKTADIAIDGDGMSRTHARVIIGKDGKAKIEDLGSTNGVFIDDDKIHSTTLIDGAKVRLGFELVLQFCHLDIATIRERQA